MSRHGPRPLMETRRFLPPGFAARQCDGDCMAAAIAEASDGVAGGTILHRALTRRCEFALVLTPNHPVKDEGLLDLAGRSGEAALSGLGPVGIPIAVMSNQGVTFGISVNGAQAVWLKVVRSVGSTGEVPDWLVLSIDVAVEPGDAEPGLQPGLTCLAEEGFGCTAGDLLGVICRHLLAAFHAWAETAAAEAVA